MADRQVPTDAEDPAGGSDARRTGRRLSDAEAVATLRRDMFGDGSLLDALGGSLPAPEETAEPDPASPPAGAVDPLLPDVAAAVDDPSLAPTGTEAAAPASLAEVPQALDAIIDSFPPEPLGDDPGPTPSTSPGYETTAPAGIATVPLPVSAIFGALDAMNKHEKEAQPARDAAPGDPAAADAPDGAGHSQADTLAPPAPDAAATADTSEPEPSVPASPGQGLQNLLSPPFPAGPDSPPHPELEGVPPFPDGAGGPPYGQPSSMPQFAAPLELVVSNPEPVEAPAYPEDQPPYEEPAGAPREFPDLAHYPVPNGAAGAAGSVASPLHSAIAASRATEAAASPMFDAAAKIAAEANATAEALENLERLLTQSVPAPEAPPAVNLRGESSPFVGTQPGPLLPLPGPPAEPPHSSIYLLGFLTGLGLSLMAGVALYFLIAMG